MKKIPGAVSPNLHKRVRAPKTPISSAPGTIFITLKSQKGFFKMIEYIESGDWVVYSGVTNGITRTSDIKTIKVVTK